MKWNIVTLGGGKTIGENSLTFFSHHNSTLIDINDLQLIDRPIDR